MVGGVLVSAGPGVNQPGKYSTYPQGAMPPGGTWMTSRMSTGSLGVHGGDG